MAEVVLFHHVLGLTDGVRAFAEELRAGRHIVHTPDLFEGVLWATIEDGAAYEDSIGEQEMSRRVEHALAGFPAGLVYAGVSSGVLRGQQLAQTRPDARGALLYEACIPVTGEWAFGPWPAALPVQIHGMDADAFFVTGHSPRRATCRRPVSSSTPSAPNKPGCSPTPATGTCSPTARCRRTTQTPPPWSSSAPVNCWTRWADHPDRPGGPPVAP